MKFPVILSLLLAMTASAVAADDALSIVDQERIIKDYMYVTGQGGQTLATEWEHEHDDYKCGTPAVLEFMQNYDKLDSRMLGALGVEFASRPTLSSYFDPPGGHVRIHYEMDPGNVNVVWKYNVDDNNDGIPDYVYKVGLAADSAYEFIFDKLGYKAPIPDTFCTTGEDALLDIYLRNLPSIYYGVTFNDTACTNSPDQREAAVWIELDNDYQGLTEYKNRPLAAARVTLAHEIFHASHFAMDATEDIAWYEMSAVWMEEQQYDQINDFYYLLPTFFAEPRVSIQSIEGVHHYASCVFPMYLSEVYGQSIIKYIWENAAVPLGHDWLLSIDRAVDSASRANCEVAVGEVCDSACLASALRDFYIWNYFTGPYASQAPEGIGYSEADSFAYYDLDSMSRHTSYPYFISYNSNPFRPQYNGASYVRFENLESLIAEDSMLSVYVFAIDSDSIPSLTWGVSAICQLRDDPEKHEIFRDTTSDWNFAGGGLFLDSVLGPIDARRYRTVTVVFTPSTPAPARYAPNTYLPLGYAVSLDSRIIAGQMPSVLSPYPNPAVVAEMGGNDLTFRFQTFTDSVGAPLTEQAYMVVDLYTVAGEHITSFEGYADVRTGGTPYGAFEIGWDMNNRAGKAVASGVYLAYARLYDSEDKAVLLAEDNVKVAVIR